MTARSAAAIASLAFLCASGCTNFYEVPIETPIQAKLDVSAFRRVLIAGFISGGLARLSQDTVQASPPGQS